MHKILIVGPQGSGKGTQAKLLAEKLDIPAFSMGDLLRDQVARATEVGLQVKDVLDSGQLVSDELARDVFKARIDEEGAEGRFIIDSYPRNMAQYEAAKSVFSPTVVLLIEVPREESMSRIVKRAEIEGRSDDTPEVIEKRLSIYDEETVPMIEAYERDGIVRRINGVGTVEEIASRINMALHID